MEIKALDWIAMILVTVGALNWLFVVFDMNLVTMLSFGAMWFEYTVYVLVGLAGLWMIKVMMDLGKKI